MVFCNSPHSFFSDPYVVAWKRGIAILTAGSVKVTPDPRVRLVNGFNLQIRDAVPQDAGDYICQIATMEPREITHTVEILGKCVAKATIAILNWHFAAQNNVHTYACTHTHAQNTRTHTHT